MGFFTGANKVSQLVVDGNLTMGTAYQTLNRKIAAGAGVLDSEDAIVHITDGYNAYALYHQVNIPNFIEQGTVRLSVALSPEYSGQTAYIKWMLNDAITPGGEQSYLYEAGSTYSTLTEDLMIRPGDKLEWWMKCVNNYFYYKEVRVLGTVTAETAGAWNLT